MSERPALTLGLPVYNGERFIEESLDSILGQTYDAFQLVISDIHRLLYKSGFQDRFFHRFPEFLDQLGRDIPCLTEHNGG